MNRYIIAIIGALIAAGAASFLIRAAQEKRRKEQQMLLEPGQIVWNGDYNEVQYVMHDRSVVTTPAVPLQILHYNGESIDPIEAIIESSPTCSIKDVIYMILSIKEESPLKVQALLYHIYCYVLTLQHKDLLEDGTVKFQAYEDGIFIPEFREILGTEDDFTLPYDKKKNEAAIKKDPDVYNMARIICRMYDGMSGELMMGFIKGTVIYKMARKSDDMAVERDEAFSTYNIIIGDLMRMSAARH